MEERETQVDRRSSHGVNGASFSFKNLNLDSWPWMCIGQRCCLPGVKRDTESPRGPKLLRIAPIMTVEETEAQRSPGRGTHELLEH